jgi:hypothetical protein
MRLTAFFSVAAVVAATHVAAQNAISDPFEQWRKPEAGHGTYNTKSVLTRRPRPLSAWVCTISSHRYFPLKSPRPMPIPQHLCESRLPATDGQIHHPERPSRRSLQRRPLRRQHLALSLRLRHLDESRTQLDLVLA